VSGGACDAIAHPDQDNIERGAASIPHHLIDADSGNVLGDIPGQKIAHGVAIVPSLGRGFITDGGGEGAIMIFDLKTYAVLGKLAAEPDADGIIYDPALGADGSGGIAEV